MNHYRDLVSMTSDISTKAEMLQRLKEREKPLPTRAPSLDLQGRLDTLRDQRQHNEDRLTHLAQRLDASKQRLDHDYAFSSLKGRSRVDFDRSR